MNFIRLLSSILIVAAFSSCSKTTIDFIINPVEHQSAPAKYTFDISPDEFESYMWDFGDGHTSKDSMPSHRYYLSGNYQITLKGIKGKKIKQIKKEVFVTAPDKCLVRIETPYGEMIAELFEETPKHRDNFVKLAEEGYYDELLFHRIIDGFMIQGGDPQSKGADSNVALGAGGPGYQIDAEFSENKAHIKGAIAAARMGDQVNPERKSSGSQFYIVHGRAVDQRTIDQFEARLGIQYPAEVQQQYLENGGVPFLDQQYTVFGQVIEGLEVIDKIANAETNNQDRPDQNITMKISVIK